jgi:hypothetical protein
VPTRPPTEALAQALSARYVPAAGQADTPPKINDALNKAVHSMTKERLVQEASVRNDMRSSYIHKTALSQATKEPQPYVRQPGAARMMRFRNGHLARDRGSSFEHTGGQMTTHLPVRTASMVPGLNPPPSTQDNIGCTDSQHAPSRRKY